MTRHCVFRRHSSRSCRMQAAANDGERKLQDVAEEADRILDLRQVLMWP